MASVVNYAESYENPPTTLAQTRQYVSNLQKILAVHAKPILVQTTSNHVEEEPPMIFESSKRILSIASLSSTGYDSNSSPSMKSNRNSVATTNSQDFLLESACSSSPSTSSIDEHQQPSSSLQTLKPWVNFSDNCSF